MPSDCTVMQYYHSSCMPNCMIGSEIAFSANVRFCKNFKIH